MCQKKPPNILATLDGKTSKTNENNLYYCLLSLLLCKDDMKTHPLVKRHTVSVFFYKKFEKTRFR
jgi:hypothetical protein